jgi:cytochrome c5
LPFAQWSAPGHWHADCNRIFVASPFSACERQGVLTMRFPFAGVLFLVSGLAGAGLAQAADGKAVYEKTCALCHATGVANAPKLGDKPAWAARVGAGPAALAASVVAGKGAMPPKAGNTALKDDEIKAAVEYMLAAVR